MLKSFKIVLLLASAVLLFANGVSGNTYVSLNGQFYITYPDTWEQIDYQTVDLFLSRSGADESMFNYDAVLAPSASSPFFIADYLILTVDKVGKLTETQTDSVLKEYSTAFQAGITYIPTDNFLADLKSNELSYDDKNKVMTVVNDIYQGQEAIKKNLVMLKFYDEGIATFYFYSPDSLFEASKDLFEGIVASFSTENLEAVMPREDVKVADIETDAEGRIKDEGSAFVQYLIYVVFLLLALAAVLILVKRKKKGLVSDQIEEKTEER